MPHKKKINLGRSLVKDRFKGQRTYRNESERHTAELGDGSDWNRINLLSVTEESSLEEFLSTAQLAGTEFTAEKMNAKFVSNHGLIGLLDEAEKKRVLDLHKQHSDSLRIPRRPSWTERTTAQELRAAEEAEFLCWRRQMSLLQQENDLLLTPYERNLEFWRQLWRVVERSDVMVQLVDARNPLLYRCGDLERLVQEQNPHRLCLLLMNKADLLTQAQRRQWARYFRKHGVLVAFFSALQHTPPSTGSRTELQQQHTPPSTVSGAELQQKDEDDCHSSGSDDGGRGESEEQGREDDGEESTGCRKECQVESSVDTVSNSLNTMCVSSDLNKNGAACRKSDITADSFTGSTDIPSNTTSSSSGTAGSTDTPSNTTSSLSGADCSTSGPTHSPSSTAASPPDTANSRAYSVQNGIPSDCLSGDHVTGEIPTEQRTVHEAGDNHLTADDEGTSALLTVSQLIVLIKSLCRRVRQLQKLPPGGSTVGFVGYPNVGKSSTMNALLGTKLTSVSATPGKTKHFQTHHLDSELVLCDCPGLVMPSFVSTRAEMVVWGVLPIDQMRDHVGPVNLLARLIPRHVLESTYGISLPAPREGEQSDRPPTAHELLSSHGMMRGFMTKHGIPDGSRSARVMLKDFVSGRLLYCLAPPDYEQQQFHSWPMGAPRSHHRPPAIVSTNLPTSASVDRSFFSSMGCRSHSRDHLGTVRTNGRVRASSANSGKPWRVKEARSTCKREKLRRVYRHLDE